MISELIRKAYYTDNVFSLKELNSIKFEDIYGNGHNSTFFKEFVKYLSKNKFPGFDQDVDNERCRKMQYSIDTNDLSLYMRMLPLKTEDIIHAFLSGHYHLILWIEEKHACYSPDWLSIIVQMVMDHRTEVLDKIIDSEKYENIRSTLHPLTKGDFENALLLNNDTVAFWLYTSPECNTPDYWYVVMCASKYGCVEFMKRLQNVHSLPKSVASDGAAHAAVNNHMELLSWYIYTIGLNANELQTTREWIYGRENEKTVLECINGI